MNRYGRLLEKMGMTEEGQGEINRHHHSELHIGRETGLLREQATSSPVSKHYQVIAVKSKISNRLISLNCKAVFGLKNKNVC